MSRIVKRKVHPLSMRLPAADIALIDRAATLRGRSRTDFVRDAAVRAAENVLMETVPIRMSSSGFKAFMAAVSGPVTSAPKWSSSSGARRLGRLALPRRRPEVWRSPIPSP
jgi:uncharacterized protein (DUF1778 family)